MGWPMDELPEINVHSYIGVIIAISGNVLIAVALNVQKYAHNQLQPGANSDAKLLHTTPTCIVEEPISNYYDGQRYQPVSATSAPFYDSSEDDCLSNDNGSIQSSQSGSSLRSNHNSDTSVQTETIAGTTRDSSGYDDSSDGSEMLYLRSKAWWLGMTLMIVGECGNFLAYGYAQASIIAPLGTVALVSNVILAPLMLKEPFRKRDLLGIVIAIVGTVVVVINSKESDVKLTPEAVVAALLRTRFVVYFIICCSAVAVLASLSDTIGSKYIFIDLSIVGIFGGYTVLATKGLSSLLSLSFYKMFTYPIAYLLVFVLVSTAVLQIKFLNKSLQRFDSTQVIPTQFVLFTTSAIIGSGILYNDFDEMDFQKGSNFLAGCLMTFIGVYFITSNRKADSGKLALETTEWAMASQSQFVPSHHHRTSLDSYTAGRALYPSEQTRTESFMEQGRVPPQSIGYVIPQPRSGRPTRNSIAAEAIGPNTPLMGTSSRQSIAGSKDQIANLTNALAGSHHTTLLLESMYSNRERRGSVQSLAGNPIPSRPGLGSRASSTYGGITTHPSALIEPHHGTSLQSMSSQLSGSGNGHATDPRMQAPHLQDRSHPLEGHRRKLSHPLFKDQRGSKGPRSSSSSSSLRAKTSPLEAPGVAIPRVKNDRHVVSSSREQDSAAGVTRSLDSVSSLTPRASTQFLPGVVFSSSPTGHGVQGSEYSIHTLKSSGSNMNNQDNSQQKGGSGVTAASIFNDHPSGSASLPPLPPSDSGTSHQHSPRNSKKRGSVGSATFSDSSSVPLLQTKHNPNVPKDRGQF